MSIIWYVFIIILVLLTVIMLSYVKIQLVYSKEENKNLLELDIKLLFIIHIKKKIPIIKVDKEEMEKTVVKENEAYINTEEADRWYEGYKKFLSRISMFKRAAKKFLRRVHIEECKWFTLVGTGDAKDTGVISGVFWGVKSYLIGQLSSYAKLEKIPHVSITPYYDRRIFRTRIDCILKFRMGNVIVLGVYLAFKYIRGGIKNV